MNICLYIIIGIIFLAPYKYLGQDNVNAMIMGIIAIFAVFSIKKIKVNKKYMISIVAMGLLSVLTLIKTSLNIDSLQGISLYISAIIIYILICNFKEEEENILKLVTYVIAIGAIFYIAYEGAILKGGVLERRIDGNVGYANSYALLMIIGIYFNKVREKDFLKEILDMVFIIGIFLTGSRSTLLYLGIFFIIDLLKIKKEIGTLNLKFGLNIIIAAVLYLSIERLGFGIIILIPLLFIIYNYIINDKHIKIVNILTMIAIPIGAITLFFKENNLIERLLHMSFGSSELLSRIKYLEDVSNYIRKNPFGGGINTYIYTQGIFQSEAYDVRYVHNSFGQALYDMGWIGLVLFIVVFAVGVLVILKGKNKNKYYYIVLYMTVYLHSMLDFDFAYIFTFTALAMIVALSGSIDVEYNINLKLITIPVAFIGIYMIFISSINLLAEFNFNHKQYESTLTLGKILDNITIGDNYGKEFQFKAHIGIYKSNKDDNEIKKSIELLEKAKNTPHRLMFIYNDLALSYEKLGNIDTAAYYYEENIKLQKYGLEIYKRYSEMYKYDKNKCNEIMDRYYKLQSKN